jgi:hypothetical protein
VNAIEPLPVVEYSTPRSLGYNGTDLFSPEMDYEVGAQELDSYLPRVNRLLQQKGKALVSKAVLSVPINQLKVFIDICHAYGLAVIFDAVYNHASSDLRDEQKHDETIFFFDRQRRGDDNRSLYFTDQDHTGPVFAFWKEEVRQFLIDNATFFVDEYHVDGFRYDQVTVIVQQNTSDGWRFCQNLTAPCELSTHQRSMSRSTGALIPQWYVRCSRAVPTSMQTGTTGCGVRSAVSSRRRPAVAMWRSIGSLSSISCGHPAFETPGARSSTSKATTRCIAIERRASRLWPEAVTGAVGMRGAAPASRSACSWPLQGSR